jgi:hypothetical protein
MLVLKGLSGASPIGFMTAVGLVRVLAEDRGLTVRLGWRNGLAVLEGIEEEPLLDALTEHMQKRHEAYEWNWAPSAKRMRPEDYAEACRQAAGDRRALAFLAAFATDTVLTDDGFIRSSRLDLTSGRQQLIADLKRLAEGLREVGEARNVFASALFGGSYERQASFGWDPVGVRSHAHEARAPTAPTPPGKRGLVWLAAEALALHPVLPVGGRAATTGCERIGQAGQSYFWPLWEEGMLDLLEVRFLRALDFKSLSRRSGVSSVWASEFGSSGKYGMLLPARRVF